MMKNFFKALSFLILCVLSPIGFASGFELSSPHLKSGGTVPDENVFNSFGCTGSNISPELTWTDPPKEAMSFALTVYDPDAPTGSGWWHWTVFNIPASARKLSKGESFKSSKLKGSIEGRTDYGKPGYGGPCPPEGDKPHRYIFTLYAMKDSKLKLNNDSSGAMVGFTLNAKMIAKTSFTAKYGRPAPAASTPSKK